MAAKGSKIQTVDATPKASPVEITTPVTNTESIPPAGVDPTPEPTQETIPVVDNRTAKQKLADLKAQAKAEKAKTAKEMADLKAQAKKEADEAKAAGKVATEGYSRMAALGEVLLANGPLTLDDIATRSNDLYTKHNTATKGAKANNLKEAKAVANYSFKLLAALDILSETKNADGKAVYSLQASVKPTAPTSEPTKE